ncbi:hypothetical protein HC766_00355 [Candidatus Gracilibacteria bacterium]|nr:hypothetical protein [Candidatus Gracilibacteria bacterium]
MGQRNYRQNGQFIQRLYCSQITQWQKIKITEEAWEINKYEFNEKNQKLEKVVIGSFTQFPIKLAWAVTIHKSQGQTFDSCIIDMGVGSFVFGQTYVAFSRCTSLEGLSLRKPIKVSDIKTDPHIIDLRKNKMELRTQLSKDY